MSRILRNMTAGALIALTPISATVAAVRPSAAVPAAASSAAVAQGTEPFGVTSGAWLPIGIMIAALALGIYIATTGDKDGQGSVSRG